MIHVMLVDSDQTIQQGLPLFFETTSHIRCAAQAEHIDEAINFLREGSNQAQLIDILIIEPLEMHLDPAVLIETMNNLDTRIKLMLLTISDRQPFPTALLQAGASAYVTKHTKPEELVNAIERVYQGGRYISPDVAQAIALSGVHDSEYYSNPFALLSDREREVLLHMLYGMKIKDISSALKLSPKTINSYRYRLFEKLRVRDDVEMTHLAIRYGIYETEEYKNLAMHASCFPVSGEGAIATSKSAAKKLTKIPSAIN